MHWIIDAILVFLISVLLAGIIIPQILLISFRKRLFDEPDERKIHKGTIPRLGGMAFMPSIIISLCLVSGFEFIFGNSLRSIIPGLGINDPSIFLSATGLTGALLPIIFGLCAIMIMYLIGIADDLIGIKYRAKLVAQVLAALLLAAGGVRIDNLHGMFGLYEIAWPIAWMLTVFLVVFIINAINLIDGIDGLASGLSGIAMGFYGMAFMAAGRWVYAFVAFAGMGTLVPFFYYNVFGNAAVGKKIFMGDTGSLTTGLLLSFLALELTQLPATGVFEADIVIVAFAPLAIPCLDVIRVFVHRVMRGKSPFLPDRVHIHHKLLALGIPQRIAMISILATSATMIALNLIMSPFFGPFTILLIDLCVWVIANYYLSRSIYARQQRLGIKKGYQ